MTHTFSGFVAKKLPPKIDAIVVGSGIGGLTTACLLARSRKRVVVLEQHDQAGGCCHTFIEKGYEFDVGKYFGHVSDIFFNSRSSELLNNF